MLLAPQEVRYEVGGIPDLSAWAGTPLAFRIDTGTLDAGSPPLEMALDHHPSGPISFDPASGTFSYEAGEGDKAPFTVTFSARRQGEAVSQSVVITPVPRIPAERDFIVSHPAQPDPASSLHIHRTVKPNDDGSEDHLVTGVRVVFDRSSDANNLHASYSVDRGRKLPDEPDPKGTVRRLTICADQLVIRGEQSPGHLRVSGEVPDRHARHAEGQDPGEDRHRRDAAQGPGRRPQGTTDPFERHSQPPFPGGRGETGYLSAEAEFVTLEGPREKDGLTWYKIDHGGTVGWVHEEGGGTGGPFGRISPA